jgi:hypothetical protein
LSRQQSTTLDNTAQVNIPGIAVPPTQYKGSLSTLEVPASTGNPSRRASELLPVPSSPSISGNLRIISDNRDSFTEAQIYKIANIVVQTIAATRQEGNFLNNYTNFRASPVPSTPAFLRNKDIGFFDPDIEDNSLGLVTSRRHTVYKDIYIFTDRLKLLATTKTDTAVHETLPTCLCRSALI